MPKAASTIKGVETTRGKAANRKATFVCACIGSCKGRKRQISEALYKKYAKYRELEGSEDSLQVERPNETIDSVSFQTENPVRAVPHLRCTLCSPLLVLCLLHLHHHLRPLLKHFKHSGHLLNHPATILCHLALSPAALSLSITILQTWLQNTQLSVPMAPLKTRKTLSTLILILDASTQIPATRILMPVLPSQRTLQHCRVFKVFLKTLNLKT